MSFSQTCGRISKSESTLTLAQNGNCVSLLYLIWFHGQVGSIQRTALKMPLWNPGGHLGILGVGMCRPGLQIGTPPKKNSSKIDTPF